MPSSSFTAVTSAACSPLPARGARDPGYEAPQIFFFSFFFNIQWKIRKTICGTCCLIMRHERCAGSTLYPLLPTIEVRSLLLIGVALSNKASSAEAFKTLEFLSWRRGDDVIMSTRAAVCSGCRRPRQMFARPQNSHVVRGQTVIVAVVMHVLSAVIPAKAIR